MLDGCGTYWSISDVYNCSDSGVVIPAGPLANYTDETVFNGVPAFGGKTGIMANAGNREPSDSGQWGIAARYFSPALSTEFGAYFVNYHQRSPVISILFDSSPSSSLFSGSPNPTYAMQYAWDWSAEDIQSYGLSLSTSIAGWSVFGEASYTHDIPVQINGLDLLRGASTGLGPLGYLAGTARNENKLFTGYALKDKTQLQLSTLKVFPRVLGAESLSVMGEVAYQHWSGIGNPSTSERYGRAFVYGQAETSTLPCSATGNANADFCEAKGFATSDAWGYRAQAQLSYPSVFAGLNVKPRVFWSHDVKGYSADSIFIENRKALGLGVGFDYLSKYTLDMSYNRFNRDAKYDVFRDRDFLSLVVGVNF